MPVLNLNTTGNEKEFQNRIGKLPLTRGGKTDLKRDVMTLIIAAVQKMNLTLFLYIRETLTKKGL
jgi:hypothetical protein